MKILILSAATGAGHLRAAHAVENYIKGNTEHTVKTVDTFKSISSILDSTICDGYSFLAKRTPSFFGKLYKSTNKDTSFAKIVPKFSALFAAQLLPTIQDFKPDIILSTHPFATEMISTLKEVGKLSLPLICIMTDYGVHKSWVSPKVDAYVVAGEHMIEGLKKFGVNPDITYPYGIPVFDMFFNHEDKDMLLREMNFSSQVPTLLFMAGSLGMSAVMNFFKKIEDIDEPLQVIIITGRNKKLYNAFEKEIAKKFLGREDKKIKLIYFTNEVERYMHASDLLVTKPGGLTVSEALACNLPLAVFDAIPGQEEDNANFLKSNDMGVRIDKGTDFPKFIAELLSEKDRLEKMRKSCETFDKSDAIPKLLSLIDTLIEKYQENQD